MAVATAVLIAGSLTATPVSAAPAPGAPAKGAPAKVACRDAVAGAAMAGLTARSCGHRVEDLAARTGSSQTFANPDGTSELSVSTEPQRVQRADGTWVAVDTTLARRADGTPAPVASTVDEVFSGGGSAPLVTTTYGAARFTLSWPAPLPVPTLDGDTATYAAVLPGVDLQVRATATGFAHLLVVQDAAAAANPALAHIGYLLGGTGVQFVGTDQGGVSVVGDDGKQLAYSGGAAMWDSSTDAGPADSPAPGGAAAHHDAGAVTPSTVQSPGDRAREAAAATRYADGRLTIDPDPGLLTGRNTHYPLIIDPTFTTLGFSRWAFADSGDANNDTTFARMGRNPFDGFLYRSYFEFPIGGLAGAHIMSASVAVKVHHTWSCGASAAFLWRSGGITTTPRSAWAPPFQAFLDGESVPTANKDSCPTPAEPTITFTGNLPGDLQIAANGGWGAYTVVLTAADGNAAGESTQARWKQWYHNATLSVLYNRAPDTPALSQLSIDPSSPCQPVPLHVNTHNGLTLRATLSDPGGDNVRAQWQVAGLPAQYAPVDSAYQGSGTPFTTTIPAAAFTDGTTYTWSVRGNDGTDAGGWSPGCGFVVDNTVPGEPTASSTDLALATGLLVPPPPATAVVGASAAVTLTPAPADKDIAGYLMSVQAGASGTPSVWVPARPDGTVAVPVAPVSSDTTNYLTVQSRDLTGQLGPTTVYKFRANPGTVTHRQNDATGDGRADITTLSDIGGGRSALWRLDTRSTGGVQSPIAPQDITAAYPTSQTRTATGDFDGDGRTDVAVFQQQGGTVTLSVQRSDGNALLGTDVWSSATWAIANMKVVAGNFDGDPAGRDDLAVMYDLGNATWQIRVFAATGTPGTATFADPTAWNTTPAGVSNWANIKLVAGDFTGDGRADIAELYQYPSCETKLFLHVSSGTAFANGALHWDSGVNNFCWDAATWTAGDFNGDGRADIAAFYRYPGCQSGLWVSYSAADGSGPGGAWSEPWASAAGAWCADLMEPSAGDFDGDGKADIGIVYRYGGPYQAKVYTFTSTGPSFGGPTAVWEGGLGPLGTGGVAVNETQRYQLVARHSNMCLSVPGGGTADGARFAQLPCDPAALNESFAVTHQYGGQYLLHPASSPGQCMDVTGASASDGAAIQQFSCHGGPNQRWEVRYVAGATDVLVHVLSLASGKCLDIPGGSGAAGTLLQQWSCNGFAWQDFFLRPISS